MAANVICISRAMFTGADAIAADVAKRLGFRIVDEEIVARAAQKRNLTAAEIASVERRKSFLSQLAMSIADSGADFASYFANDKESKRPSDELLQLIREAIFETADEGNVVIVAHAASYALARRKHVLRVLVTGSEFGRVNKWLPTAGGRSPREAAQQIRESDEARANYLKRFYDVAHEAPEHYDITLSVDALSAEQITELIVRAAALVD